MPDTLLSKYEDYIIVNPILKIAAFFDTVHRYASAAWRGEITANGFYCVEQEEGVTIAGSSLSFLITIE